jgi:2-polyprenyl-3-methyl-5-hydroxy-6-metoxy-1,4-benzoquinol methylase
MGSAEDAFRSFLTWTIEVEWPAHAAFLPDGEREAFADYYRSLPRAGDSAAVRRFLRGYWRSEAGWTARWIADRARARREVRVMDAGSGFGTFAMLYASVGAEVIAADLRPDRLHAAEARIAHHARVTGRRLPVRQLRADLTKPWEDAVDLVWVYNALSHIDPLEGFLAEVRRRLRPGGVIVIGDINGAHPAHLARLAGLRTEVHQEYVAPDGTRHAYAVERTFPPAELRGIMESNGFRIVHHELYWGGMGVLPDPLYAALRLLQSRWRLGHRRARRQLLVATPAAGGSA